MQRSHWTTTSIAVAAFLLRPALVIAAQRPPTFEDIARLSDLVINGTVIGPSGETHTLPDGTAITLGVKISDHVFTPYRVRIDDCLYDVDGACPSGELEVLVPGGTLLETIDGETRLRTWDLTGAASAPLPTAGTPVVLFLQKYKGRYRPFNDAGARLTVSNASGQDRVRVRFTSPQLLSPSDLASADRVAPEAPSPLQPAFTEDVPLNRLKAMIAAARARRDVPKRSPR